MGTATNAIELEGISKTFRDGEREVRALEGLSLSVPKGTVMALTGESGSGKSTLLHIIGGLEWPTSGRVVVAGAELQSLGDRELTRFRLTRIGFVFQFFQLLPSLNVMENLCLPAELAGHPRRDAQKKARELLEAVGIADCEKAFPDALSGGQQQRAAIARGLMLEPSLLLADEPTGNLDSKTGSQVLSLILGLARERGATVLLATHSMEVAAAASRVVELQDGRVKTDSASVATKPAPPSIEAGRTPS